MAWAQEVVLVRRQSKGLQASKASTSMPSGGRRRAWHGLGTFPDPTLRVVRESGSESRTHNVRLLGSDHHGRHPHCLFLL